jgi:serine/threonine protein phosphatase PrpC
MSVVQSTGAEFVVAGCTGQHVGDRAEQQDRVAILRSALAPRSVLGLLADGLGGRSGGALAAEQVLLVAQRLFDQFRDDDPVERFFEDLVHEVHTVLRLSAITAHLEPHSTLAAVVVRPARIDWCHVGDSRVYHFRGLRTLSRSTDDTFTEHLISTQRLSPDRARLHPSGARLTQALGGTRTPHPNIGGTRTPGPRDSVLLCSDGLWAHFEDRELARIVHEHPAREASERLIESARDRARGHGDNCSLVLLKREASAD